jgi:heparosan-N-sulfate-glucuronate 5-epimerase
MLSESTSSTEKKEVPQVELDRSGVPIVTYGYMDETYIGPQRNPTTVSTTATDHYSIYKSNGNETAREIFLNNSDWLVNNAVSYGNYSLLEYDFPWLYNMKPPWQSGMGQALAMQALIKAHQESGKEKYLDTARMLLNSFFVEVKDGGFTYKTPNEGWWYEEYADIGGKEPRVLNGMMFALVGLYDYYLYTNDLDSKFLFDQGIRALKQNLPAYDDVSYSYSYYDSLKTTNPLSYHNIHIELLSKLYNITGEKTFEVYHDRWMNYENPPFLRNGPA